jgi:hypothetical protein
MKVDLARFSEHMVFENRVLRRISGSKRGSNRSLERNA